MTKLGHHLILILLAIILIAGELSLGSVKIPFGEILSILGGDDGARESWQLIVLKSRLPRTLGAMTAGAALSVAGLMMQTLFRNPLAGPHILGVSSGSGLGVAVAIMGMSLFGLSMSSFAGHALLLIASVSGGLLVLFILFAVSLRVRDMLTVLIIGVMTGSIAMALVGILQYLSPDQNVKSFVIWTLGSFDGITLEDLRFFLPAILILMFFVLFLLKPLNLLLSGEEYAHSLGLNVRSGRLQIMLVAGGLTALATAYCGPIGFVGVIVPHFSRMLFRTNDHKTLWLGTILIGMNIVLLADLVAHLPGSSRILPVNSITSLIGIPFICWMLISKRILRTT